LRGFRLRKEESAKQHGIVCETVGAKWDQGYATDDERPGSKELYECWSRRIVPSDAEFARNDSSYSAQNARGWPASDEDG
jgi:hypothetical protein